MATPKVIVLGALQGKLSTAFARLATLHSKNNFALAVVAGNLFSPDPAVPGSDETAALLDGSIKVPLPTYFTHGTTPFPAAVALRIAADEEICPNVHFLPRNSLVKTSEGVRIFALGGPRADAPKRKAAAPAPAHQENGENGENGEKMEVDNGKEGDEAASNDTPDSKALATARNADILLTTWWPTDVFTKSHVSLGASPADIPVSQSLATVCATIRPKYHFASSPSTFFFEREPFVHPHAESEPAEVTRFISMAPFGNEAKAKSMYAFSLPSTSSAADVPANATVSPFYYTPVKRSRADDDDGAGLFSRFTDSGDRGRMPMRKNRKHNKSPPPGPDRCYFCLSNPTNSSHMCCSIGEEAYLATAKGPLTTSTTWKEHGINFPCHFIMTPLAHQSTIASMGSATDPASDASRTYAEMNRFRTSLEAMIATRSKHNLGAVTWEISRAGNIHLHWQLIAVPADAIRKGLVDAAFKVEAENYHYPAFEERDLSLDDQADLGDYFRIWIYADNGEDRVKGRSLVMPLDPYSRFDLQFGRKVLAKLLGLETRFVWKECVQHRHEEERDVTAFRDAFKEWDFTLEQE